MQYLSIKGTGLKVSRFCLGTMMFGGQTDKDESVRIIDYALDNGVNFFDTADTYTGGQSEAIVGEALEGKGRMPLSLPKSTTLKGRFRISPDSEGSTSLRTWMRASGN